MTLGLRVDTANDDTIDEHNHKLEHSEDIDERSHTLEHDNDDKEVERNTVRDAKENELVKDDAITTIGLLANDDDAMSLTSLVNIELANEDTTITIVLQAGPLPTTVPR